MKLVGKAFDIMGDAASTYSQLVANMQNREISKIEKKYDKQIKAAQKAGKDTTKLEEEKEAAIDQIKKKYADKEFAATIMQVIAKTAQAIMVAWTAGPILGPIPVSYTHLCFTTAVCCRLPDWRD